MYREVNKVSWNYSATLKKILRDENLFKMTQCEQFFNNSNEKEIYSNFFVFRFNNLLYHMSNFLTWTLIFIFPDISLLHNGHLLYLWSSKKVSGLWSSNVSLTMQTYEISL